MAQNKWWQAFRNDRGGCVPPQARRKALNKRFRPTLELLEERCTPTVGMTYVDDNWADITHPTGTVVIGDTIKNTNDTINPGTITAIYGSTGFGTVVNMSGTQSVAGAAKIDDAIAATNVAGTVDVLEGTYSEQVTVNKSLTVEGAQHGVDARTRAGAESIVDGTNNGGATPFNVTASDVAIDGFTVEGATNANTFGFGILLGAGTSGAFVANNIIQNNIAGLSLSNSSTVDSAVIEHNLFRNNTQAGPASGTDIYSDQFNAGGTLNDVLIDNNTFTNTAFVENAYALGISNTAAAAFTNITFSNNTVTNHGRGAYFFNTNGATVTGNTITGASHYAIGLIGANGTPANSAFTISNNLLNPNGTGGAGVELVDDTTPGFAYTGALTLSGDHYTTRGADHAILNESATPINATGEFFNGTAASSASTAQLFATKDTVVDAIDVAGYGLVRLKAGNIYVTGNSFFAPGGTTTPSLQRAINAASAGDTVNVNTGTYSGDVTLGNNLTLNLGIAGAAIHLQGTFNLNAGTTTNAGGVVTLAGSSVMNVTGHLNVAVNGSLATYGVLNVQAGATLNDAGLLVVQGGARLNTYGLAVIGGGGRFDDYGETVIVARGELATYGEVVIERGGRVDAYGETVIQSGGRLDDYGELAVDPNGRLDDFGIAVIDPGARMDNYGVFVVQAKASLYNYGVIVNNTSGQLYAYGAVINETQGYLYNYGTFTIVHPSGVLYNFGYFFEEPGATFNR